MDEKKELGCLKCCTQAVGEAIKQEAEVKLKIKELKVDFSIIICLNYCEKAPQRGNITACLLCALQYLLILSVDVHGCRMPDLISVV